MNEKFTPGEWRAEITSHEFCDTGDYVTDFGIVTDKTGIAQCFDNSVINEEEAEANCYLIAAAPEMYLVLDAIYDVMMDSSDCGTIPVDKIEAVLKKARGEA